MPPPTPGSAPALGDDRCHAAEKRVRAANLASSGELDEWHGALRAWTQDLVGAFVREQSTRHIRDVEAAELLAQMVLDYACGGKYLRSRCVYIGWLCGADTDERAVRAAGSAELLHAFALMQDDIMDGSTLRRGSAAAQVRLAEWHRSQGLTGSADAFGCSAATLLSDLCLVWAEQLFRESGLGQSALDRAWPHYDAMRSELAMGQFADLLNDARRTPAFEDVLDVARRKSGNYTVRRPLELGAALAGCGGSVLQVLGSYGALVGEAFQLRDDLLGVFGDPASTRKPTGEDLADRKATSVVMLAYELAAPSQQRTMDEFFSAVSLDPAAIDAWRALIVETGARAQIETLIEERVTTALDRVADAPLDAAAHILLRDLAVRCSDRCG